MCKLRTTITVLMAVMLSCLFALRAEATTWNLTSANIPNFGPGPYGSVSVTQNGANTLLFNVLLNPSLSFWGGANALGFNLNGGPSVTFANFTTGWSGTNGLPTNDQMDGYGNFMYTPDAPGHGASQDNGQSLSFNVSATGLTLASLIASTQGGNPTSWLFAVHVFCYVTVCGTNDGNAWTGFVAAGLTPIPLPAGLLLFLTGLGGIGVMGRMRAKRSVTSA